MRFRWSGRTLLSEALRTSGSRHLSPALFAGERPGEGATFGRSTKWFEAPRSLPYPNLPQSFLGEVRA
jgi:hypothetical protein